LSEPVRIVLAEGDAPTRAGLRLSLERAGYDVVAQAGDHEAALRAVASEQPDVVLLATDLPGGGLPTTQRITELSPRTRIIVMTAEPGGDELVAAVLAGAAGYLPKGMALGRLAHAVRGVVDGEVALPRRYSARLLEEVRGRDAERTRVDAQASAALTDREWEVLRLLREGASTAEMAQRLRISDVTVRRHVSTLLAKLGVADRQSAAAIIRRSSK
jgi:DNA-binding NarL/FixJ family response regulator